MQPVTISRYTALQCGESLTLTTTSDIYGKALDTRTARALMLLIVCKGDVDYSSDYLMQIIHYVYQEAIGKATLSININKMGIKIPISKYAGETALANFEQYYDTSRYTSYYR